MIGRCCPNCGHALPDQNGIAMDVDARTVSYAGVTVSLQSKLFAIFALLAKRLGRLVTHEAIFDQLYAHLPDADWPEPRITTVHICKLRAALRPTELTIKTVWGAGVVLDLPASNDGGGYEHALSEIGCASAAAAERAGAAPRDA